jgi:D-alanine-D-alanine ligase-like ATP-grasp enzyme
VETQRCVTDAGFELEDVLPVDTVVEVRKTANLHTGGTLHDVTADLHPAIADASVRAASYLDIPVIGLDYIVERPDGGPRATAPIDDLATESQHSAV